MAIKKGAFQIYAQERQLPNKDIKSKQLKSPFFENLDNNGSQTVHKRFTDSEATVLDQGVNQKYKIQSAEHNNGSQTVHNKTDALEPLPIDSSKNNGSQTVHKRFTDSEATVLDQGVNQKYKIQSAEHNNGSQMVHNKTDALEPLPIDSSKNNGSQTVHKRFTDSEATVLDQGVNQKYKIQSAEHNNGSQMVHNKTDALEPLPIDSSKNNGSQTVHKRFTDSEATVLDQGVNQKYKIQSAEHNNGSQMVHKKKEENIVLGQTIKFSKLGGIQRDVVIAFYKCIQLNDLHTTKELTLDEISILARVNKKSLKNTLFRLANAGYIIRAEQKIGRAGWVKYRLNSCLYEELNNIGVVYGLKKR